MAKHNYKLRVEGKLDPAQVGGAINTIYPNFFSKAQAFFGTEEGMAEYIEWLKGIPEDSVLAKYKEELPKAEAEYQGMEVAI